MMKLVLTMVTAALLVTGCSKPADNSVVTAATVPLDPSIYAAAVREGTNIVREAFGLLSSNLQSAIQQGGISNALPYCSAAALPLTRGLAEKRGIGIRRVTHRPRNAHGRAEGVELLVLQRFADSLADSNTPPPVVTNLAPGTVTFFAPIVLNPPLCLKCHGEPEKDIAPEDVAVIDRLYPHDQAKGFKLGELRGAWRIDFPLTGLPASKTPGK